MDKRRGNRGNSIFSWIIAVVLITAAAAAIGWFAGEGLMALMSRGNAQVDLADYADERADEEAPEEDAAADEAAIEGAEADVPNDQTIELPAVSVPETSDDGSKPSPFGTPPWISDNLSIVPLEPSEPEEDVSAEADVTEEPATEFEEAAEEPAEETTEPVSEPSEEPSGPVIPSLYKVRVGPYATRQEATSAAQELAKLQLPTLIVQGYYVQIGAFGSEANAENLKAKIAGYGFPVSIF